MDQMILLPAKGQESHDVLKATMPWVDRGDRSWWKAWFSSAGMALVTPGEFAQSVPTGATLKSALWFAIVSLLMTLALTSIPAALICCIGGGLAGTLGGGESVVSVMAIIAAIFLGGMIGLAILGVLWQMIWATTIHGLMHIGGETVFGLKRTVILVLYGTATLVVTAVPVIGGFVGYPWHWVSTIGIIRSGQRVSTVRASVSVLMLPVLIVLGTVGGYVTMVIWAISMASTTITAAQVSQTSSLGSGLQEWVSDVGDWPPSGGMLVATDSVSPWNLIDATSDLNPAHNSLLGVSITSLEAMTPQEAVASWELAGLEETAYPHRLGTIAFTYHGVNPAEIPDGVWLVVRMVNRGDPVGFMSRAAVVVYTKNGVMRGESIDQVDFAAAMIGQNELRRSLGLPELQDLEALPDVSDDWGVTSPRSR